MAAEVMKQVPFLPFQGGWFHTIMIALFFRKSVTNDEVIGTPTILFCHFPARAPKRLRSLPLGLAAPLFFDVLTDKPKPRATGRLGHWAPAEDDAGWQEVARYAATGLGWGEPGLFAHSASR